jgi:predicted acylesterase/phospholipase RssA
VTESAPPARDLAITFAGGGNRAFYQLGLMRRWGSLLADRIAVLATCSAGACVAAMYLADRGAAARDLWLERTRGITRNFDWRRLLRGERLAPHGAIFREVMTTIAEAGGLERIRQAPFPVLVLASGFPDALPGGLAVLVGIGAYQLERTLRPTRLHPTLGRRLAFTPAVFDMRDCDTPDDLADLVLASSATPPFTPLGRFRGRALLDGGMVDNAPAFLGDAMPGVTRNLVFLTRPYTPPPGVVGRRCYVTPSAPPPLERWDYTRPHLIDANVTLGEQDADRYLATLEAFLSSPASPASDTPP